MPVWINFKELRQQLRFADVLKHYKVSAKIRGDRVTAFCPLPGHPQRTDGKPRTASLSVNLARNIFRCFGCNQSGNALEFACRMEGFDPLKKDEFRQAAMKIAEVFKIDAKGKGGDMETTKKPEPPPIGREIIVNAPLDFELQNLDPNHPYLLERGFTPDTIRHFGLGYCNRGLMRGRVAIPIHDRYGKLVGYAGRVTQDESISDENPKYRFPGERTRKGVVYQFRKSLLLYNHHRLARRNRKLVVVEGFAATWWLSQFGHDAGALMGNSCSEEQGELIVDLTLPDGIVFIISDGDEAGIQCAHSVFEHVAPKRSVRWVRLPLGKQPTDFDGTALGEMLRI